MPYHISDEDFGELVEAAVESITERFARKMNNIAVWVDGTPSPDQLRAGGILHRHTTLLGLYTGIPLPRRTNSGYSGVVPDVITIFKHPHEQFSDNLEDLRAQVKQTVWHEVAHYFGLDHGQIRALED